MLQAKHLLQVISIIITHLEHNFRFPLNELQRRIPFHHHHKSFHAYYFISLLYHPITTNGKRDDYRNMNSHVKALING